MTSTPARFDRTRLLLCLGPGGVGKTTCSAAVSLAAARRGRTVAVVTIDPSERLAQALGLADGAGRGVPVPVGTCESTGGSLAAAVLDAPAVFRTMVEDAADSPAQAREILDNPVYRATVEHLGGALEYAAVALVERLGRGPYDLVVLDTPPAASARAFLQAPARIAEVAQNPVARVLAMPGRVGGRLFGSFGARQIDRVLRSMGGGAFLQTLGGFLRHFSTVVAAFEQRAAALRARLKSTGTASLIVTTPAAFALKEALAFAEELDGLEIPVAGLVLNRAEPPHPPPPAPEDVAAWLGTAGRGEGPAAVLLAHYEGLLREARIADRARRHVAAARPSLPLATVYRRARAPTSREELAELGERLLEELFVETGPADPPGTRA